LNFLRSVFVLGLYFDQENFIDFLSDSKWRLMSKMAALRFGRKKSFCLLQSVYILTSNMTQTNILPNQPKMVDDPKWRVKISFLS
jgi:hypothetical protein